MIFSYTISIKYYKIIQVHEHHLLIFNWKILFLKNPSGIFHKKGLHIEKPFLKYNDFENTN